MLMNLKTLQWDETMLNIFELKIENLPVIKSCCYDFGNINIPELDYLTNCKVTCILGDQQSATLGQFCLEGEAKCTYGTGAFMLLNTGENIIYSKNGLLTTLSFQLGENEKV